MFFEHSEKMIGKITPKSCGLDPVNLLYENNP